ncbi:DNA-binding protein HGH1 [Seminavis robusta]|uniref:DNA-binding protein HGH1 n=1 Tax=Seminavis robusta TaxID=568900 RepID=A0A9N8ETA5_9STRA|nr:DNA-binding protein HGH1 [Seminavis robusta]|eukprot:Sro2061_g312930.1 DNA-binding protein HGH1 (248) ;mRNA; f:2489-3232
MFRFLLSTNSLRAHFTAALPGIPQQSTQQKYSMTGANKDESQMYQDLTGFLVAERVDLRLAATEAVLQVRDAEGMEKMIANGLVKPLAKNFNHSNPTIGVNALQAMVLISSNSSTSHKCLEELLLAGGINRVMEVILSAPPPATTTTNDNNPLVEWKKRVNFALAILANLTRDEVGAVELVGKTLPEKAVAPEALTPEEREKLPTKPLLELMLSRFLRDEFCSPPPQKDTTKIMTMMTILPTVNKRQ